MKTSCNLIVLLSLASLGSSASSIQITLSAPDQMGSPGQTLQFFGVLTDTTSDPKPIYLNSDSFTFSLNASDYTLTDNFASLPLSLSAGQSSGALDLFDITLANTALAGIYHGAYGLVGGEDGGTGTGMNNLGQASFSATVTTATVPEPGTTALLGISLASIVAALRFRKLPLLQ